MLTFSPGENVLLVETEKYAFEFCARTGRVNKTRKQKNTLHTLSRLGCTSLSPSKCSSDKRQGNCRCPAGDATSAKDGAATRQVSDAASLHDYDLSAPCGRRPRCRQLSRQHRSTIDYGRQTPSNGKVCFVRAGGKRECPLAPQQRHPSIASRCSVPAGFSRQRIQK